MDSIEQLRKVLSKLPIGNIKSKTKEYPSIYSLLVECWDLLDIDGDLATHKLTRIENLTHAGADILTFEIERHGPTVLGSVYGLIHQWTVDLANRKAICDPYKKRLLYEKSKSLNVEPLAQNVFNDIISGKKHPLCQCE